MAGMVYGESGGVVNDFGFGQNSNYLSFGTGNPGVGDMQLLGNYNIYAIPSVGASHIASATRVNSNGYVSIFVDGALDNQGTLAAGPRSQSTNIPICASYDGNHVLMGEYVIFPSVLNNTDLATITSNQRTYWGTP